MISNVNDALAMNAGDLEDNENMNAPVSEKVKNEFRNKHPFFDNGDKTILLNNDNMKERKYENALYYIKGALAAQEILDEDAISRLEDFLDDVLKEDEPSKQVIRG